MSLGRPSAKVAPPQKVIRALESHRSTNPQELSYQKGDFWYVTSEREGWYEALNPLTGSRGLVPKADFEEFAKGGRQTSGGRPPSSQETARSHTPSTGHLSQQSNPRSPPIQQTITSPPDPSKKNYQPFVYINLHDEARDPRLMDRLYAIVQYDFIAERPDELNAKAGEPIVIIAQSNHEWFVAKPIGRLGGPGLIPVAFVQIRDTVTGKPVDKLPESIPLVEEWKKATANYNAAKIPLGKFDFAPGEQSVTDSPYAPSTQSGTRNSQQQSSTSLPRTSSYSSLPKASASSGSASVRTPVYRPEVDPQLPPGQLTSLSVPSFHNENGNYWFRLQVTFVPDDPSGPGYSLTLYRTYEDFYDFQINLLDTFPYEAGRPPADRPDASPPERILPYMPGPVDEDIDDELTEYRREELDTYVRALLDLGDRGKDFIVRHELFRAFFAAKYGDYCEEVARPDGVRSGDAEGMEELDERMGGMGLEYEQSGGDGVGSGYLGQNGSRLSAGHSQAGHNYGHSRGQSQSQSRGDSGHDRYSPSTSVSALSQPGPSRSTSSRNPSPLPPVDTSRPSSSGSQAYSAAAHVRQPSSSTQGHSYGHGYGYGAGGAAPNSAGPSTAASVSTNGGGANPPPYIKIKIYDRATDDLIAIRVHPDVNHADLFEKVRSRLGNEVRALRYRVGMGSGSGSGVNPGNGAGGGYEELRDDEDLRWWLSKEDQKLVLYAET